MQPLYPNSEQSRRLRAGLVQFGRDLGVTHHVTATLRPGSTKLVLEDKLGEWVVRVNRACLGREWFKEAQKPNRMRGLVFFESGRGRNNFHAHLVVRPPPCMTLLNFEEVGPCIFAGPPLGSIANRIKPLAPGGSMLIQEIGRRDLEKVILYDTKEMEVWSQAYEDWKDIDHLTRRMA